MILPILRSARENSFKISFPNLDFIKSSSIKYHEKIQSHFGFSHRFCYKISLPIQSFGNFFLPFKKKGVGGDRKLICFHLKIYVILFNSFCLFLSEHIDVFWMFLLPTVKSKTVIQNKKKDRQSVASSQLKVVRLNEAMETFLTK